MLLRDDEDLVEAMINRGYTLFPLSTKKTVREMFPMIDQMNVFSLLKDDELVYSSLMGLKCSPVTMSTLSEEGKAKVSSKVAFKNRWEGMHREYAIKLPDKIAMAIAAFSTMELPARLRVRLMAEQTLLNCQAVLSYNVRQHMEKSGGIINPEVVNEFLDAAKKAAALMQMVLPMCEAGSMGVAETNEDTLTFEPGEVMAALHARRE